MSNSKSVNAYTSDGRIQQIEYAMKASSLGTTSLAFVSSNKVFLVSEKKITTTLQIPPPKHCKVFDHIVFSFSGISSDARKIIDIARHISLMHFRFYNEKIPIEGLLKDLCHMALKFGEKDVTKKIFNRPFGCSILCAGYEDGPVVYTFDPSGSYRRYKRIAIGSGSESLENDLDDIVDLKSALMCIKKVMKDAIRSDNVEILEISEEGVKVFSENEIQDLVSNLSTVE